MPTQQPSLSHKKWFQTLVIVNVLFTFLLSFTGAFKGPNGIYVMGFSLVVSLAIIVYSMVKGLSDWKLVLIYGLIAMALIMNVLLQTKHY